MRRQVNIFRQLDYTTAGIYLLLILIGWLSIYASVYNEEHGNIFDISQRYGMQLIWIISSIFLTITVLLINHKFFSVLAYIIYGSIILLLMLVLVAGVEVNGSRSWFAIGQVRLQPAELAKVAASLALARFMCQYNFNLKKLQNILMIGVIILLPMALILLQSDTGSALVFVSLLLMLYREGLSGWVVSIAAFCIMLFILSIIWEPVSVLLFIWIACLALYLFFNKNKYKVLLMGIASIGSYSLIINYLLPVLKLSIDYDYLFLGICVITLIVEGIIAVRKKIKSFWLILLIFVSTVAITSSVDYVYDHLLQQHHRNRIEEMLGIRDDPQGTGYNVNQSKIAIGSGGLTGKGFLHGTQTKYNFVPEQSTDFIFCTIGEEWGFAGVLIVIALFAWLLVKIVEISERQRDAFARIYGYCVASIIGFHVFLNIAMTIGLAPVIGIPLPFISYGGSSLWAFTIMLFILLKFDAVKWE
ncbi:MAG: rod shape-determining protein RodA [Bacteroidales bacterium]|nr:rod shape-determining protein RodA [Bacteroidales bacterium]MCL2133352.1 rod shape-determining protein RodA [Bacteroidales bacterium]